MDSQQISTKAVDPQASGSTTVEISKRLTPVQDDYITFVAAHGLEINEDGNYNRVSAQEFAIKIGVERTTLYYWQKSIPNFWELVDARSREIFHRNRKYAILRGLTLRALKGDAKQAEMLWSHFGDYIPPTQRHEVRVEGLTDLAAIARKKQEKMDNAPNNSTD